MPDCPTIAFACQPLDEPISIKAWHSAGGLRCRLLIENLSFLI
jgi:hypothetical protein